MQRTQIYLPKELRQQLAEISADTGESLSELMRKGAQEIIKNSAKLKKQKKSKAEELRAFFAGLDGSWGGDYDVMAERRKRAEKLYGNQNNN